MLISVKYIANIYLIINITLNNFLLYLILVTCETGTKNWRHPLFWKYLLIRVALDVLRASSLMLFEGALIVTIKEQVFMN